MFDIHAWLSRARRQDSWRRQVGILADQLWRHAGSPPGRKKEFWDQAERQKAEFETQCWRIVCRWLDGAPHDYLTGQTDRPALHGDGYFEIIEEELQRPETLSSYA